jgi:hypothetical protein
MIELIDCPGLDEVTDLSLHHLVSQILRKVSCVVYLMEPMDESKRHTIANVNQIKAELESFGRLDSTDVIFITTKLDTIDLDRPIESLLSNIKDTIRNTLFSLFSRHDHNPLAHFGCSARDTNIAYGMARLCEDSSVLREGRLHYDLANARQRKLIKGYYDVYPGQGGRRRIQPIPVSDIRANIKQLWEDSRMRSVSHRMLGFSPLRFFLRGTLDAIHVLNTRTNGNFSKASMKQQLAELELIKETIAGARLKAEDVEALREEFMELAGTTEANCEAIVKRFFERYGKPATEVEQPPLQALLTRQDGDSMLASTSRNELDGWLLDLKREILTNVFQSIRDTVSSKKLAAVRTMKTALCVSDTRMHSEMQPSTTHLDDLQSDKTFERFTTIVPRWRWRSTGVQHVHEEAVRDWGRRPDDYRAYSCVYTNVLGWCTVHALLVQVECSQAWLRSRGSKNRSVCSVRRPAIDREGRCLHCYRV